jgi:1,4-dihydroxy-2-naphthoate octaprenyltransferase
MIKLMKRTFIYFFFLMILINITENAYKHYFDKENKNDYISGKNR